MSSLAFRLDFFYPHYQIEINCSFELIAEYVPSTDNTNEFVKLNQLIMFKDIWMWIWYIAIEMDDKYILWI